MNKSNSFHTTDNATIRAQNTEDAIYFNFSYAALKLLGKNLYSNAANAISELVANSIDARAHNVYVYIDMSDKAHSIIEILDDGSGMDYSDLAEKYVWIGRNKRADEAFSPNERCRIMGRKGIGKLAALYLSNQYYIYTHKESDENTSVWGVNLSAYNDSDFPKLDKVNKAEPLVNTCIWSSFSHGTAIKLSNVDLRGNGEKKIESLRRVFADFYLIDAIESVVYVAVKTDKDTSADFVPVKKQVAYKNFYALFDNSGYHIAEKMSKTISFTWLSKYEHIGKKPRDTDVINMKSEATRGKRFFHKEDGSTIEKEYILKGWIAAHATIDSKYALDENFLRTPVYQPNRLRLYVRNKIAVEDYYSIAPSTQAMANYIEGEISFDILDDDDLPDIATSSRQDFLEDERIELLVSIVNPILSSLYNSRLRVGKAIADENDEYTEKLRLEEEERRKEEERARKQAEENAERAETARVQAEASAERERKRSKYLIEIGSVEDKNILNSVHSIYNMSYRIKSNLDGLNSIVSYSQEGLSRLEKAVISNQRILSMSKLITKAGRVIDDNDVRKEVNLTAFVCEYVNKVLNTIYEEDIKIECVGEIESVFIKKIKPLSFVMMLDNLVGNAIKASSHHLLIIIDNAKQNEYVIKLKDDGNGMDPTIKDKERLFEFGITTTGGSGLGLYYARKQMKELGGSIDIQQNNDIGVSIILKWSK